MESSSKSFVYVRRGEGERETNAMEDGRDAKRDDGRIGHRFEGKVMRKKRGLRDVTSGDNKKHLSKFKRISERGNSSPDRDRDDERRHGSPGGKELSWKEIAERKQGRNKLLNGKGESEGDGSGKGPDERKDRGKIQSGGSFKGSKGVESKFSSKRKQSSSLEFDVPNGDSKRKKSSEPIKKRRHRLILQDHSDDDDYYVRPVPAKKDPNPPENGVVEGKDTEKEADPDVAAVNIPAQPDQGVRKSSRVPKRKVLEDFEDEPPEIGPPKGGRQKQGDGDGKYDSQESDSNDENEAGASDRAGSESDADAEDWNDEMDSSKSKQTKTRDVTKSSDPFSYGGKGRSAPLTARQRSILLEKDGDASVGLIEFPDGLSHFTRRGATKLSVEDRQAKKAEAASRRKQVVEKAAKEMQATAIQKILGQDSSRRKKEDRLQKQREEIQQGKKAAAMEAPSNSVRWTIGPQGTTVSWSLDAKVPEIFCPSAYPPAPQKCAAPSCSNARKYQCSKSSLPLCSLQCYRAVHSPTNLVST